MLLNKKFNCLKLEAIGVSNPKTHETNGIGPNFEGQKQKKHWLYLILI
jgi:hypothetical protein